MIQIHPNLFLGSDADADKAIGAACIVHCAKEPYHRKALGYTGRAAEKSHPFERSRFTGASSLEETQPAAASSHTPRRG